MSSLRKFILPAIAAIVVVVVAVVALMPKGGEVARVEGDSLVIDAAQLTDQVTFVPYNANGAKTSIMVVKNGDDVTCRLDTCNSCNGSPAAYYEPDGNGKIICQNCGFDFDLDNLDAAKGGCSPMNIQAQVEGDQVKIKTSTLDAVAPLFTNISRS